MAQKSCFSWEWVCHYMNHMLAPELTFPCSLPAYPRPSRLKKGRQSPLGNKLWRNPSKIEDQGPVARSGDEGQWGGVQAGCKGTSTAQGGAHHWCQVSLLFSCDLGLENRPFLFAGHSRKLQSVWPLGESALLQCWPCGGQEWGRWGGWEHPFPPPWSGEWDESGVHLGGHFFVTI